MVKSEMGIEIIVRVKRDLKENGMKFFNVWNDKKDVILSYVSPWESGARIWVEGSYPYEFSYVDILS